MDLVAGLVFLIFGIVAWALAKAAGRNKRLR
jgi:hypothetical protein